MTTQFILDTNLFFNLQSGLVWGKNSKEIFEVCITFAKKLVPSQKASFYMTPGIVEELHSFLPENPKYLQELLTYTTIQSPNSANSVIDSHVVSSLIEEARTRAYRGMKIAEEEIDAAAQSMMGKNIKPSSVEYQKELGVTISKFRERFRHATRFNFLDSVVDLELILLAREVGGALVSADEGLIRWARLIGVVEVSPNDLKSVFESLV